MSQPEISRSDTMDALARILLSADFGAAPRLAAFLSYVVTETLEGRASKVKAYTIATQVFGRSDTFDPQTNPIVRVEAMRLRQCLGHYYATAGAAEEVEIRIGRGSYVPEFLRRSPTPAAQPGARQTIDSTVTPARRAGTSAARWAIAALAVLAMAAAAMLTMRRPAADMDREAAPARQTAAAAGPTVTVQIDSPADSGLQTFAADLAQKIEANLSHFDYPLVVGQGSGHRHYLVSATVRSAPDDTVSISARVVHQTSSAVLWAHDFRGLKRSLTDSIAVDISHALSETHGVIFSDIRRRTDGNALASPGVDCVIASSTALGEGDAEARGRARRCLEATISGDPAGSPAYQALAFIRTALWLDGQSDDSSIEGMRAARDDAARAVSLEVHKSRSHAALFWTRFFSGRTDDAFESAQSAMELNPYAGDTMARIGAARMLRGQMDDGFALMQKAQRGDRYLPGWREFYYFLHSWSAGELADASRHAERAAALTSPLGFVARLIARQQSSHSLESIEEVRRDFAARYPGFAADVSAGLKRYAMIPELRDRILAAMSARTDQPAQRR